MAAEQAGGVRRPLVSVVIAAHNYGRFVGGAIESLQEQSCRDWECVVVDDGSTDDTAEVVGRYVRADARVRYVYQKNGGPSSARNAGVRRSAGKYLQFLDADDMLAPGKLESQVSFLERHPEVDIVYGDMEYFGADGEGWMPRETPSGGGDEVLPALVRANITGIHAALSRREPVVYFDEELIGPEDWYYWVCCAMAGKRFHYVPGRHALTRLQEVSLSKNLLRMYAYILRVRIKLAASLEDPHLRALNRELMRADEETVVGLARGARDLLRVARITRSAKWLRLAVTVPLARRPSVSRVRKFLRRG